MIDESVFQAGLDDNPDDHGLRLIFADWLADNGDDRCDGYRWLGENGKRPFLSRGHTAGKSRTNAAWFVAAKKLPRELDYCKDYKAVIPMKFFDSLRDFKPITPYRWFDNRRQAEDAFCAAFLAVQRAEAVAAAVKAQAERGYA